MAEGPLTVIGGGVAVAISLSPRTRADRLIGLAAAESGHQVLKAAVTAPAEGGRANAALLGLLARSWRLPQSTLSIVRGATSRKKLVRIAGDPQQLIAKISAEIARLPSQ